MALTVEAREDQGTGAESSGDDGAFTQGNKHHAFGHYRRSKTNKAPRKRTFIANMTKYTEIESAALESASKGVGVGMGSGSNHVLGLGAGQSMLPTGEPGDSASAGGPGSRVPAHGQFASLSASGDQPLPWGLQALPTLADPVVWGTKQLSTGLSASDEAIGTYMSSSASGPFTELLNGTSNMEALFSNWNETVPAGHDEYNAMVAAATAAAAMVVSGSAMNMPQAAIGHSMASSMSSLAPSTSPKVSFDLFPELAALAGDSIALEGGQDASRNVLVMPAHACFSRAVVTGVEGGRSMANGMAFAPAPAPVQLAASSPAVSAMTGASAGPISSLPHSFDRAHQQAASHYCAPGVSDDGLAAAAEFPIGSWPSSQASLHDTSRSTSSCGTAAWKASMGPMHAPMQHQVSGMQTASTASLGSAISGTTTLPSSATGQVAQQKTSPYTGAPAAAEVVFAGLLQAQATGGRGTGRRGNGGAGGARGRGTKRTSAGASLFAASGPVSVAASASAAARAVAAAGATVAGSTSSSGGVAAREPPFVMPLHGVSVAGAVVPGGAGELRMTSLVSVGAYGLVYRGRWGERDVAVKVMRTPQPGEGLTAADVLQSFRHEADLLRRIAHPNIIAVKHSQDVEPVCIVQDFATHGTLSDYIHAPTPSALGALGGAARLPPASDLERAVLRRLARRCALNPDALIANLEARSVASAMGQGAAHANQRLLRRYVVLLCLLRDVASAFVYLAAPPGQALPPVVHRDVKPTNILLSMQGTALLADFGVAKVLGATAPPTVPVPAAVPRLAPANSAPAPTSGAPFSSEFASMFTVWSEDLASWGISGGPAAAKRPRTDPAMPAPVSWDPLPSADMDLAWLDSLLNGDGDQGQESAGNAVQVKAQEPAAAGAAAVEGVASAGAAVAAAPSPAPSTAGGASGGAQRSGGQSCSWPNHRGTAHYAAPEDLCPNGYPLTPAADMFSLGYCIWEALTASRPWAGERSADVAAGVGRAGARLPLPAAWPPRMASLVSRCWAADPAMRPAPGQVLAELDAEIRTVLGGSL